MSAGLIRKLNERLNPPIRTVSAPDMVDGGYRVVVEYMDGRCDVEFFGCGDAGRDGMGGAWNAAQGYVEYMRRRQAGQQR